MSASGHPRAWDSYQTLMELVKTTALLKKAGDRFFKEHGLTQSQFNVLMVLKYDTPQGCTQSELSRRMLVNRADMSGLVRRMEKQELVKRVDVPHDERAWTVKVSRQGKTVLEKIEPVYYAKVRSLMSVHTDRGSLAFSESLKRTQEGIRKHAF